MSATPILVKERVALATGGTYTNWELARGATAFVDSLTPQHHVVFARFPEEVDRRLWQAERLLPLFLGWDVKRTDCVDGWGLCFKNQPLQTVMGRIDEIIEE